MLSNQANGSSDPAPKLFQDRRKLMDMFDDDLDEMLTPVPTYTYSLKPYFSLNYSENDVLAICNMVRQKYPLVNRY